MRVAVTGANGFIGSALCRKLRSMGHEVVAVVRDPAEVEASRIVVAGEIGRAIDWTFAITGCDAVIHLAGRAHVTTRSHDASLFEYRRVNRDGALALGRQAAALGVRRLIFVSTILVNGSNGRCPFTVNDAAAPRDAYAISKHEAEIGLFELAARTRMELVVVRPPLVYGPNVRANFLRLLRLAGSGIPLPLAGVQGIRSLISRWNLNDLFALCVVHPKAAGRVILASDGEDVSLPDLVRVLAHAMGRPCRLFSAPPGVLRTIAGGLGARATLDKLCASLRVDISETQRLLGWKPPVSLLDGLTRTGQWYAERFRRATARSPQALPGLTWSAHAEEDFPTTGAPQVVEEDLHCSVK